MESKLCRYQSSLVISGTGVIAFGVWSVIKVFIGFLIMPDQMGIELELRKTALFWVVLVVMALLSLLLHAFVGLSARSEGKKGKTRYVYLVFDVLMLLFSIATLVSYFLIPIEDIFDFIARLLVELTFIAATAEVLVSSIMVKKIKKEMQG